MAALLHLHQAQVAAAAAGGVVESLGIRFARPPTGELRFSESVLLDEPGSSWVPGADAFGPACLQKAAPQNLTMSEDCLFLNIWADSKCTRAEPCPVLFWIHGGSDETGSGAQYNGSALAAVTGRLVVVTVNYRLGPLGFLPAPLGGGEATLGLNGVLDNVCALRWVQRHIGAYSGDASAVTIAGESAGSVAVYLLSVSRLARGLFRSAIMQSGAGGPWNPGPFNKTASEATYQGFLAAVNASSLEQLRQLPAEAVAVWPSGVGKAPGVDRRVVTEDPALLYSQEGEINPRSFVIGANSRDGIVPFILAGPLVPTTPLAGTWQCVLFALAVSLT